MQEKILVIGGNGFIGSHLVEGLRRTGAGVRVLDQRDALFSDPLPDVDYRIGDCADVSALKPALRGCNTVVHLAHSSSPVTSADAPADEVLNSMKVFTTLVECARNADIRRFVFFSSGGAVYGLPERKPVDESQAEWPISPYGVSKACMEKYLRMYSYTHGLPYLVLRPSNAYGPRQNYKARQGIIPIFIYRMLTNQRISIWGDGCTAKDYIYIDDLIQGTLALLTSEVKNETFNLGSGHFAAINTILAAIRKVCGRDGDVTYEPSKVEDVHDIILDSEKMRRCTGWVASTSLEEGVERTFRWIQAHIKHES